MSRLVVGLLAVLASPALGGPPTAAQEPVLETAPLCVALLPFADHAGFQGAWNLARDVPALLGRQLAQQAGMSVVPLDSVEVALRAARRERPQGVELAARLGREVGADVVITGRVERFGVRRFSAGDPNLAGYRSYRYQIEIADVQLIRVASEEVVATLAAERDSVERPFALDLFGRPRQQDRELRELLQVEFGSPRFWELPFGRLTAEVFAELGARVVAVLLERPPLLLGDRQAGVLAADSLGVYLGIGSENGAEHGDLLSLYRGDVRVGVVEVDEVIGPRLCKARIVTGDGQVEPGDRIGQRLPRTGHAGDASKPVPTNKEQ
ncbi:MAG: hypothetical protein AB1505_10480 [Candidatus Latescibacterota bacterium]